MNIVKLAVNNEAFTVGIETNDKVNPVVIFLVGTSGGALSERFNSLAKLFVDDGFTFVRFNYRGQEEGKNIDNYSLKDELNDVRAVIKYLEENGYNIGKLSVIGKSFGAVKAFAISNERKLSCIGLLSPATYFSELGNLEETLNQKYSEIAKLDDLLLPHTFAQQVKCPVLIVHGNQDTTVSLSNSQKIFELLQVTEKELFIIDGADHSMKEEQYANVAFKKVVDFFMKNNT